MALTKKQVKQLRGLATKLNPLIQVGKNDLSENAVKQADETIEKRELIKCSVLDAARPPNPLGRWAASYGNKQSEESVPENQLS